MSKYSTALGTILSAKAATGVGTSINVKGFRHLLLEVTSASSANLTVKVQGSIADTEPTFSSAASGTNAWDYIGTYNLQSGSFIAGDTGVVYSGTDAIELLTINVDGLNWINCDVTARAAGNVTVKVQKYND